MERGTFKDQLGKLTGKLKLDEMIEHSHHANNHRLLPDLPHDLASIEIEAALPKLGPLSSGGIE